MPELPEVQTVVDYLKSILSGKTIKSVKSPNGYFNVFASGHLIEYQEFLVDKQIISLGRRGKYIIIVLNFGYLIVHLRMTGRIVLEQPKTKEIKYVSFQLIFSDGSKLFFRDTRKFGQVYICKNLNWLEDRLGMEPLSKHFTPIWLYEQLQQHRRIIKSILLDQQFIAGLGNIYVDEALWKAQIHPKTKSNRIGKKRCKKLCFAIQNILSHAIDNKGTTIIDFSYGKNEKGNFINQLQVFGRENKPCPQCQASITKMFVVQRGTHYCKKCQKI